MTYLYVCGEHAVERTYEGKAPERIRVGRLTYRKERIVFEGAIHAFTMTGEKLHKHEERAYRTNKKTAEMLATGTGFVPDNRDATGDKQSRESINQFNRFYSDAKEKAGKPLIK